ncbi:hypothetical protein [Clostridium butyricum]|uniref:hypothetical protein n=1 Tax=Clostridium butyricum TaxID=1492 RepID=UPI002ABD1551|nr:hypothetical protein [Clostridium butyricum]
MSCNLKYGICALCKKERKLELSHIIPKFVPRRLKKKSPTGFLRNAFEPDERLQDGTKEYLLCGECEDRFNVWETEFSKKVFHPYKNKKLDDFEYDDWLAKFIISVNWRTLYLDLQGFKKEKNISEENIALLEESEKILREYILEERTDIGDIEVNMFLFDDIKSASPEIAECNPHEFFNHSLFDYTNIQTTDYGTGIGVIANLSGILIYTIIKKVSIENSENTKVSLGSGKFKISNQKTNSPIIGDVFNYMKESREAQKGISDEQMKRIVDSVKKSGKYENSEIALNRKKDNELKDK